MESFKIRPTIGGFITIPGNPEGHPLLSKLHRDDGDGERVSRRLEWESLKDGLDRIKTVAQRLGMSVRVCGNIKHSPTVILRELTLAAEEETLHPFAGLSGDAGHCGLSELYPENEAVLRAAIASGGPFNTDWFSCKKESWTGRITRYKRNGPIHIKASAETDESHALVDTAFWRAAGGNSAYDSGFDVLSHLGLSDEEIDSEIESVSDLMELGEEITANAETEIHWKSGYDKVMNRLSLLVDECETELEIQYQSLVSYCVEELERLKSKT